jgi:hypothetical protein
MHSNTRPPLPVPDQSLPNTPRHVLKMYKYERRLSHASLQSSPPEVERRLVALRIAHPDNLDVRCVLHVVHRLRRNEDELAPDRALRGLDDHAHAAFAVDAVHEDIAAYISKSLSGSSKVYLQLVEAADG